ncbi:hypothetical protein [Clostridium sp. VAP52]|uniref:hypothetical protein n=1 Tax=Clostridium sp. VAP52 TaxID=2949977 RepID=UPI00207A1F58|nr:hypothetical protein [Clostridium sp. VAP52]
MNEYNELENLMYAIGTQLYDKDMILHDLFDNRFNHTYSSFSYCSSETDKIEQLEIIRGLKKEFSLVELFQKAMLEADYYRLHQLYWTISNYNEKIKDYKLNNESIVKKEELSEMFKTRIAELKDLNLDSWRKSNDEVLHHHYYYWINHLMNDEDYTLWALEYSDTNIFDIFHLSNYGYKTLPKILLKYILDNNIIPNQMDLKSELNLISPFVTHKGHNGYKIKYSSDMGGMWYKIYLIARELQEIYKSVGSAKIRKMNTMPFFSYVNALKDDYEKDTKFYLYFEG